MRTPTVALALALLLAGTTARGQASDEPEPDPDGGVPVEAEPTEQVDAGPEPDQEQPATPVDEELLAELEAAAEADAEQLEENKGADATKAESIEEEDPLNLLPEGAREVLGNETNPSISIILDFAGAYFSSENRIHQGGHAPSTNGPTIQGAELAASASIDPFFRIDMAFGMWHLHMEEIYLTTTSLPLNLQIRAGKFKSNIGRHNPTHLHSWNFVLHPLANEFMFGAEGLAPPGIELSVLFPLPWYVELVGALQMGDSGAFRTKSLAEGDPHFKDFIYPVRLVQFFDLSRDLALQLGLNTVHGTSQSAPENGNRTYAYGADLFFKWRPIGWGQTGYTYIAWTTEGWYRQMEVAGDLWDDLGGYSDIVFGIAKRWNVAVRGELWRRLGGRNTNASINRDNYGLDTARGSGALSFMPSHFSRVRLQYTFERIEGFDDNHIALLQLEVSAGAHGAHKY
jgi:hypothetical protein